MQNVTARKILLNSCFANVKEIKQQIVANKKQGFVKRLPYLYSLLQKEQDLINDLVS